MSLPVPADGYDAGHPRTALTYMLISCVAYQNGRKLADIPKEDISEYVNRPDCFVWVALYEPSLEELDEMAEEFGLHELAVDDARHGHQRPKIEEYGDSLFAVLHTVEQVKAPDGDDELRHRRGRHLRRPQLHPVGAASHAGGFRRRAHALRARARAAAQRLGLRVLRADGQRGRPLLSRSSTRSNPSSRRSRNRSSCAGEARSNIESLYALKQKLMMLKHAVDPLMEATGRLYGGRVPQICSGMSEYFRDVYDHLHRIHASIEGIREMLTTAIQVNLGMISLSDNEVTKKLAAWAAIIAVPTMIAGVYGMNFEHMPELKWTFGYPLALLAMVVIDVYLYFHFKKVKWL